MKRIRLFHITPALAALLLCGCTQKTPRPLEAEILEGPALTAQFTVSPDAALPTEETPEPPEPPEDGAAEPGASEQVAGTVTVEGQTQAVMLTRYHSPLFYTLDYDPAFFTLSAEAGTDRYAAPAAKGAEPAAFLTVTEDWDHTLKQAVDRLIAAYGVTEPAAAVHIGTGSYAATMLTVVGGAEPDSRVVSCYIVPVNETLLLFTLSCTVEALEGYGVRMQAMLDSIAF